MTDHGYDEPMSLALDGQLPPQERAALDLHLAACADCRKRWEAFQSIDLALSSAQAVMPAPGFAARVAARLAQQQQAQQAAQYRLAAWLGALTAALTAAAIGLVPGFLAIGQWVSALPSRFPSIVGNTLTVIGHWLLALWALGEAGESVAGLLASSGGPILAAYTIVLIAILAGWVWVMRSVYRRGNRIVISIL